MKQPAGKFIYFAVVFPEFFLHTQDKSLKEQKWLFELSVNQGKSFYFLYINAYSYLSFTKMQLGWDGQWVAKKMSVSCRISNWVFTKTNRLNYINHKVEKDSSDTFWTTLYYTENIWYRYMISIYDICQFWTLGEGRENWQASSHYHSAHIGTIKVSIDLQIHLFGLLRETENQNKEHYV